MQQKALKKDKSPIDLARVINIISSLDYPDPARIAKEIIEFKNETNDDIESIIKRLQNGEPWDYVRGYTIFCNEKYFVDRSVLIPRIETEILVDLTKEVINKVLNDERDLELIDVGTGSGCIIISLMKWHEDDPSRILSANGIDISKEALNIAKLNAEKIVPNISDKIKFTKGDLLRNYANISETSIKIITANLPYISLDEKEELDTSVIDWEPHTALFDNSPDGSGLTRKLLEQTVERFRHFYIIFELDAGQVDIMKQYLSSGVFSKEAVVFSFHKDQFDRKRFLIVHQA